MLMPGYRALPAPHPSSRLINIDLTFKATVLKPVLKCDLTLYHFDLCLHKLVKEIIF